MSTNQTPPKPETVQASPQGLAPVPLFAVGDRVIATCELTQPPSDELPGQHFCDVGDELEIRQVRPNGWYVVAHPWREAGAGFLIRHRELDSANDKDQATDGAHNQNQPTKSK